MHPDDEDCITLKDYREYKLKLHGELLDICRDYLNKISIVSILGIIEIVKQEIMELEKATKKDITNEKSDFDELG